MNALKPNSTRSIASSLLSRGRGRSRSIASTSASSSSSSSHLDAASNSSSASSSSPPPPPSPSTTTTSTKKPKRSSSPLPTVLPEYPAIPPLSPFIPIRPTSSSVHVASIHLRSYTSSLPALTFFTQFALRSARALGLRTIGPIPLPTRTTLITVPRSPFVHKKSQQNFWRKEHKRLVEVFDGNPEVVEAWLAYLRKEAMGGVGVKAQVFKYVPVGWARNGTDQGQLVGQEKEGGELDKEVERLAKELEQELKAGVEESEKGEVEVQGVRKQLEENELKEVEESEQEPKQEPEPEPVKVEAPKEEEPTTIQGRQAKHKTTPSSSKQQKQGKEAHETI